MKNVIVDGLCAPAKCDSSLTLNNNNTGDNLLHPTHAALGGDMRSLATRLMCHVISELRAASVEERSRRMQQRHTPSGTVTANGAASSNGGGSTNF